MALATVTVLVALIAGDALVHRMLPPSWSWMAITPLGPISPISYLVSAASMTLGGAIAGRRFLIVAMGLSLASWVIALAVVGNMQTQVGAPQHPLPGMLASNAFSILLSLAAAALGAHAGARWLERRQAPASP